MVKQQSDSSTEADVLEFDFDNFTAANFRDLVKAQRENDIDAAAQIYARIITTCPAAWGDPTNPETYTQLKFRLWNRIPVLMTEAIKEDAKK